MASGPAAGSGQGPGSLRGGPWCGASLAEGLVQCPGLFSLLAMKGESCPWSEGERGV